MFTGAAPDNYYFAKIYNSDMWKSPGKLKQLSMLINQRLFGKLTIWQDIELRYRLLRASVNGRRLEPTEIGFHWKTWAYVCFWQSPLTVDIQTNSGTISKSEENAICAAFDRYEPSIKPTALDQLVRWLDTENINVDVKNKAISASPTLKLNLRESMVPGTFSLTFEIRTGNFYSIDIRAWSVVSEIDDEG